MKAIRVHEFGSPEVLAFEEENAPTPGPGQVLVRIMAAGVNPVETYIRSGTYRIKPALPYTPGSDAGGVVEAVGEGVAHTRPGDRVFTSGSITGTYAELALCTPEQIHPLPETVSFMQAAALGVPYATAHRALFGRAKAVAGETVLVHGASGGVGIAAVQLAVAAGLTVVGTAGTDRGLELVRRQGAHYALNHNEPDYLEEILSINCARGVDIVLEMLANANLNKDLGIIAKTGRIVVIGSRGKVEIDPRQAMARDGDILGMSLINTPREELALIYESLAEMLARSDIAPVVGREFPLADAAAAHEAVLQPGAHGKIVLAV